MQVFKAKFTQDFHGEQADLQMLVHLRLIKVAGAARQLDFAVLRLIGNT